MSRESELNLMRGMNGEVARTHSRPSTDQFRDNYDQIDWHRKDWGKDKFLPVKGYHRDPATGEPIKDADQ